MNWPNIPIYIIVGAAITLFVVDLLRDILRDTYREGYDKGREDAADWWAQAAKDVEEMRKREIRYEEEQN